MIKKSAIALMFIALILLFFFGFYQSDLIFESPFKFEFALNNVEIAITDQARNVVFFDKAQKAFVKFDKNSTLVWKRSFKKLELPSDLTVDNSGRIFVLNNIPAESKTDSPRAQILSIEADGTGMRFLGEFDLRNGEVFQNLSFSKDELSWYELGSDYVRVHRVNVLMGTHQSEIIVKDSLEVGSVISVVNLGDRYFASLIGGRFCQIEQGGFKQTEKDYTQLESPWWMGVAGDSLVWNELTDQSLYSSPLNQKSRNLVFDQVRLGDTQVSGTESVYTKIGLTEKYVTLVFPDSIGITDLVNGGHSNLFSYKLTEIQIFQQILQYLFLLESILLISYFIFRCIKFVLKVGMGLQLIATILVASVQSGLCIVFAVFDAKYQESFELASNKAALDTAASIIAAAFPSQSLVGINNKKYEEEKYRRITDYIGSLVQTLPRSKASVSVIIIYKLDGERIRTVCSSNRGIGTLQVSPEFDDPSKAYWISLQGNTVAREVQSSSGSLITALSPVKDPNGQVVGLVELLSSKQEIEKIGETISQDRDRNIFFGLILLNAILVLSISAYKISKRFFLKQPKSPKTSITELRKRDQRISYLLDVGNIFQNSVQEFYDRMARKHKENNLLYLGFDIDRDIPTDKDELMISDFVYQFASFVNKNKSIFALLKSRDLVVSITQEFDAFKTVVYNLNIASSDIVKKDGFGRLRYRSIAFFHFSPKVSREVFSSSLVVSNRLSEILKRFHYFGTFMIANADSQLTSNMSLLKLCHLRFKNANGHYIVYEIIDGLHYERRQTKGLSRRSVEAFSNLVSSGDFGSATEHLSQDTEIPIYMKEFYACLLGFYAHSGTREPSSVYLEDIVIYLEGHG